MPVEKTVKLRKPQICHSCCIEIPKGENAIFMAGRVGSFDGDNEVQVGIYYYKVYLHIDPCICEANETKND